MGETLREQLEASWEANEQESTTEETSNTGGVDTEGEEPVIEATADARTDGTPPEPEQEIIEDEPVPEQEESPVEEDPEAPEDAVGEAPEGDLEPAAAAPVGWRGAAKQHWNKLPPEVQAEVNRREQETTSVLQQSADARQFYHTFEELARPYQHMFTSENVHPLAAAKDLFQTAAELRTGTAEQRAGIVYRLIQQHGVDLPLLDKMLMNEAPAPGAPQVDPGIQSLLQQELAPIKQAFSTFQQQQVQQQRASSAEVQTEVQKFASNPNNVFFEDVRHQMGDLIEAASKRGQSLSMDQAYKAAVSLIPELVKLEAQRKGPENAQKQMTRAERRARAASTLASKPQPETAAPQMTREQQLSAAWDAFAQG